MYIYIYVCVCVCVYIYLFMNVFQDYFLQQERSTPAQMIELFFKYFSTIDVHDHFRQGSLGMERAQHTHSWWHRLFATLFGMTVVDAFLGYRYESLEAHGSPMELTEFIEKLAHQLIFNDFLQDGPNLRHREGVSDDEEVKFALTLTLNTHLGMLELIFFFFFGFFCV